MFRRLGRRKKHSKLYLKVAKEAKKEAEEELITLNQALAEEEQFMTEAVARQYQQSFDDEEFQLFQQWKKDKNSKSKYSIIRYKF